VSSEDPVARAWREERAAVLATLIRHVGDFQLAEDAVQDAFAAAVIAWPRDGVPASPKAWLTVAARRRAVDRLRRERANVDRVARLAELARLNAQEHLADQEEDAVQDDRLAGVLAVVYLIFNEGYGAAAGEALVRGELCGEAIRLGRLLVVLMPDDAEVRGLLALMLLHDARREARVDASGAFVALDQQDRSLWDAGRAREGVGELDAALRRRRPGPYQLQAAIAALHVQAPSPEEVDWEQIAQLYGALAQLSPSAVVELNRAVAVGFAAGPQAGLALLEPLGEQLADYQPLFAARAELLRRAALT
jgi:predicted RNA polymerase sigma factor